MKQKGKDTQFSTFSFTFSCLTLFKAAVCNFLKHFFTYLLKLTICFDSITRQIICEKVLLLPSSEMHCSRSNITNQNQEKGLSAVNQVCVCTAQCANGAETAYCYRKTIYQPSLVTMQTSLSIPSRLDVGN